MTTSQSHAFDPDARNAVRCVCGFEPTIGSPTARAAAFNEHLASHRGRERQAIAVIRDDEVSVAQRVNDLLDAIAALPGVVRELRVDDATATMVRGWAATHGLTVVECVEFHDDMRTRSIDVRREQTTIVTCAWPSEPMFARESPWRP